MSALATIPRVTLPTLEQVPLDSIEIGTNVRIDPGELEEMATSIRELGVIQPVKVERLREGKFQLLWGQRRVLGARAAGLETIPAIVVDDLSWSPGRREARDRPIEQLVENLQRADLNDMEEAVAIRAVLTADPELTQAALAIRLGRSPSWLANALRLLELDPEVQAHVRSGGITSSHAKAIASLPPKQQRDIATRIVRDKLPAHRIESELAWKRQEAETEAARAKRTQKWIPKTIAALEAADVPKDAVVQMSPGYNVEAAPILKAIKAAGWKKAEPGVSWYGGYGTGPSKDCDCTSFRLEVGGRKPEVAKHCTNELHKSSAVRERDRAENEKRKQRDRELEVLRDGLARELQASAIRPEVLRLIWRGTVSYGAATEPKDVCKAIAHNVIADWRYREENLRPVFAELGLEFPEPKPAKAKKAKA